MTIYNEYQTNRTIDLMSEFFVYESKFKQAIDNGLSFIDSHEWQIKAANIINDIKEEGLLTKAKEIYSWEAPTIDDYLEIYNEIKSGVRI